MIKTLYFVLYMCDWLTFPMAFQMALHQFPTDYIYELHIFQKLYLEHAALCLFYIKLLFLKKYNPSQKPRGKT